MKANIIKSILLLFVCILASCGKENGVAIDTTYPVINIASTNAFPVQCSVITRGQKMIFKANFSDNLSLGSYTLDIHHNFDHHTHSTEVASCGLDPVKTPVKPFVFIQSFDIPSGKALFDATNEIMVPLDVDPGDYHFMIKLTDKEGWQTLKGISVKII